MTKEIFSPKNSFKGFNIFTMIEKNKKTIIMSLTMILFLFLVIKMLVSSEVYTAEMVILQPAGIAAAFWTAAQTFLYFRSEQKR